MTATRYFSHPSTLEELKEQYRRLAFEYHPDRGGDGDGAGKNFGFFVLFC